MYIQVINGYVNLIGGAEEGLPLPESYLSDNPNVICLNAEDYEELPEIGQYYDAENDEFVWQRKEEEDVLYSALTSEEIAAVKALLGGEIDEQ